MKDDRKRLLIAILKAFFLVSGVVSYFETADLLSYRTIFNYILFAGFVTADLKKPAVSRRTVFCSYLFGGTLAGSLLLGRAIDISNDYRVLFSGLSSSIWTIVCFLGFLFFFSCILTYLFSYISRLEIKKSAEIKGTNSLIPFLFFWTLIIIFWFPCFLALYPGIFDYDCAWQTHEALQGISGFSKYHPPLHTLLWSLCLFAGNTLGIEALAIYSVITMLFLSFVFALFIASLIKRQINNKIILGVFLFIAVNPIFSLFSIELSKDVYFCGMFLLAVLQLCKAAESPEQFAQSKASIIKYTLAATLACLFRNNAVYAFFLSIPFICLLLKHYWKKYILILLIPIFLFGVINGPVYSMLHIREGRAGESLCVPMQQLARTVIEEEALTREEIESIYHYLDYEAIPQIYNPRFADPVKATLKRDYYKNHQKEFVLLWASMLHKYPSDYINAFLELNLPYWYLDANTLDPYASRDYIEIEINANDEYTVARNSKLPFLEDYYRSAADYSLFQKTPLFSTAFSISLPVWALLLCAFILLSKKKYLQIIPLIPSFFTWLTFMAGPVSNFRYIFPLYSMYPLWFVLAIQPEQFERGRL